MKLIAVCLCWSSFYSCTPVRITNDLVASCQKRCLAKRSTLAMLMVYPLSHDVKFLCRNEAEYSDWPDEWIDSD